MSKKTAKKYTVRLPRVHGEEAKYVGIDGVGYLVRRGVEVEVPKRVYLELNRCASAEERNEARAAALAQ